MTTISIDVMGGDFGPEVTIPAAVESLKLDKELNIILVGKEHLINTHLSDLDKETFQSRLRIHHASEVVEMDESPALALKKKKDSSMRVAINLVKDGESQAAVSAGNTGALMATSRFVLKMIPGVDRPAICSTLPTEHSTVHMLDLGANVDSTPEMLLQFAYMGSEICKVTHNIKNPRIHLLNVGSEEIKGNAKVKATASLLNASNLNYQGYIEGDEIFTDKSDLIVCDGFEGNIALKTAEGVARLISNITKNELSKSPLRKLFAMFSIAAFQSIKKRLDPREHNGATLAGLRGVVIKSHGGTDIAGFLAAIRVASSEAKRQLPDRISAAINELSHVEKKEVSDEHGLDKKLDKQSES